MRTQNKKVKKVTAKKPSVIKQLESRVYELDAQLSQIIFRVKALESMAVLAREAKPAPVGYNYVIESCPAEAKTAEDTSSISIPPPSTPRPYIESAAFKEHKLFTKMK